MADSNEPPQGRFSRFRKLASLSASLGTSVVTRGVKRLAGGEAEMFGKGAAEKLVATLGDLKGAAMKIGQAASMDPDLFTPEIRQILAKLQNQAPAMNFARVREVVTDELGGPLETLFAHVEEQALAAASLGQVHRATLKDGRKVVIKIQYPGIEDALKSDIANVGMLVKAFSATSKAMDGRAYYQEFARELTHELDYEREADSAEAFAKASAHVPSLVIPEVIRNRTSKKVLTLEWLDGITLKDFFADLPNRSNDERFAVSANLVRAINGPFLKEGLIHADPHPGNFMVMADGRLGVMDFGSVKRLSEAFYVAHRESLGKVARNEALDVLGMLRAVGFTMDLPAEQAESFIHELLHIIGRPMRSDDYDFAQDTITADVRRLGTQNAAKFLRIRPPPEAVLFFKAVGGLGQNLKALGARGNFRAVYDELTAGLGRP